MFPPSRITISRSAFAKNLSFIRDQLHGARLCSVVKGNAYGHGIQPFVHLAMDAGVDYFGVYSADEAYALLGSVEKRPDLFLMGMAEGDGLAWAIENGVECCIQDGSRLAHALRLAQGMRTKAKIHVEVETGMHRTGFRLNQLSKVIALLEEFKDHFELVGLFTHFAGAESQVNDERVREQIAQFERAQHLVQRSGLSFKHLHQACSAGVMNYPETIGTMARVGIMQYGFWSNDETWYRYSAMHGRAPDPLRRLINWTSSVMALTDVKAGDHIGYGASCEAQNDMRIAVVPVGYAHGFDRGLSNFGRVLIHGQQARITGIVNMNAMSVDVTGISGVEKGDPVTLIGEQDGQTITVSSFSEMSEQLNYEMLTRLPSNIPRSIID